VRYCEERGHDLEGLAVEDLPKIDPRLGPGLLEAITLEHALASRTGYGCTAPAAVREQIGRFEAAIDARRQFALEEIGAKTAVAANSAEAGKR
jgi:argininosuccinate lyase